MTPDEADQVAAWAADYGTRDPLLMAYVRLRADLAAAAALAEYRKAQRRMLERWADGDEAVKRELWRELHACEQPATDALEAAALRPAGDQAKGGG